eukprot:jgi/Chlat1/596/Chrsp103S01029
MRLLTHNLLASNVRGVQNGYPLGIKADKVEVKEVPYNPDLLRNFWAKIDYAALRGAAAAISEDLPELQDASTMPDDEEFMHKLHRALLEVHVEEGELICPETGRKFPIKKGIPNMLLNEDEV